jgi:hypothetical protein
MNFLSIGVSRMQQRFSPLKKMMDIVLSVEVALVLVGGSKANNATCDMTVEVLDGVVGANDENDG